VGFTRKNMSKRASDRVASSKKLFGESIKKFSSSLQSKIGNDDDDDNERDVLTRRDETRSHARESIGRSDISEQNDQLSNNEGEFVPNRKFAEGSTMLGQRVPLAMPSDTRRVLRSPKIPPLKPESSSSSTTTSSSKIDGAFRSKLKEEQKSSSSSFSKRFIVTERPRPREESSEPEWSKQSSSSEFKLSITDTDKDELEEKKSKLKHQPVQSSKGRSEKNHDEADRRASLFRPREKSQKKEEEEEAIDDEDEHEKLSSSEKKVTEKTPKKRLSFGRLFKKKKSEESSSDDDDNNHKPIVTKDDIPGSDKTSKDEIPDTFEFRKQEQTLFDEEENYFDRRRRQQNLFGSNLEVAATATTDVIDATKEESPTLTRFSPLLTSPRRIKFGMSQVREFDESKPTPAFGRRSNRLLSRNTPPVLEKPATKDIPSEQLEMTPQNNGTLSQAETAKIQKPESATFAEHPFAEMLPPEIKSKNMENLAVGMEKMLQQQELFNEQSENYKQYFRQQWDRRKQRPEQTEEEKLQQDDEQSDDNSDKSSLEKDAKKPTLIEKTQRFLKGYDEKKRQYEKKLGQKRIVGVVLILFILLVLLSAGAGFAFKLKPFEKFKQVVKDKVAHIKTSKGKKSRDEAATQDDVDEAANQPPAQEPPQQESKPTPTQVATTANFTQKVQEETIDVAKTANIHSKDLDLPDETSTSAASSSTTSQKIIESASSNPLSDILRAKLDAKMVSLKTSLSKLDNAEECMEL
jgi:hypothetical protein